MQLDQQTITLLLAALAALHVVVQALLGITSTLESLAARTETDVDDRAVSVFGRTVRGLARVLSTLELVTAPASKLRRK